MLTDAGPSAVVVTKNACPLWIVSDAEELGVEVVAVTVVKPPRKPRFGSQYV